jgi:phosphomannomutase
MKDYSTKRLVVFDLDGTLAPSKSIADHEMARLLLCLLENKKVAVIGGGKYFQFQEQLLGRLPRRDPRLQNLFLFPTTSNAFYRYHAGWKNVYAMKLPTSIKTSIKKALRDILKEINYTPPKKIYGVTLEDRATQMSFSPLGQDIVAKLGAKGIRMKEEWKKKNNPIRLKIARLLSKRLPNLEVRVGGLTTIDITRKGIDKAFGIEQIKKTLKISIRDMVFIGDALYPGGNDYAAKKTGIDCVAVRDPEDTKRMIEKIIAK